MTIVYILVAIVMLGVLIFLHEGGHYLMGRLMNIGIEEFAIGMGPKIFSRKGTHKIKVNGKIEQETTTYSLRLLPLGGFCAFVGEDENNSDPRAMNNAPVWKRLLTVAAGPVTNLLVAFLIGWVLIATATVPNLYSTQNAYIEISGTIEGLPAEESYIKSGDIILSVDGIDMIGNGTDTMKSYISSLEPGSSVKIWVQRGSVSLPVSVRTARSESGETMLGVYLTQYATRAEYDCNVLEAMGESAVLMKNIFVDTFESLGGLLRKLFSGQSIPEGSVSGVVGIVSNVSTGLRASFDEDFLSGITLFFLYMMLISESLGIMNLLPLPALDGGRLAVLIIELITKKHLNRRVEGYINLAGLALLLCLMAVVTFSDVKMLIK
ncbi:MAG: site-2 protease family protein [Clostridia bacterium]|nr:site-2 protease family protein [Clostridia bacterium]